MKMLDYIKMANARLSENLEDAASLVSPVVGAFVASGLDSVRIVASGSSRHASDCAREFMERTLGMPVLVETPEAYVSHEGAHMVDAFNIAISQSGYSTNTLAALDSMRREGASVVALTGNVKSPIAEHAEVVVDYGVGVESVDFVTMGVMALIEFLVLFAGFAAGDGESAVDGLRDAVDAHAAMLERSMGFVGEHGHVLSRKSPIIVVGNGPLYGVAEEAALKFCETLKVPAMHFEGEEFVHGPEMQITPDYTVFILDDPEGSKRLASIAHAISRVAGATFFVTARPSGEPYEVPVPAVARPELAAIPVLVLFQWIAASVTERLSCWDVHPYLAEVEDELAAKAAGYDASVKELERRAASRYEDAAR